MLVVQNDASPDTRKFIKETGVFKIPKTILRKQNTQLLLKNYRKEQIPSIKMESITLMINILVGAYDENELDKEDWNNDMDEARCWNDLKQMRNCQDVRPLILDS